MNSFDDKELERIAKETATRLLQRDGYPYEKILKALKQIRDAYAASARLDKTIIESLRRAEGARLVGPSDEHALLRRNQFILDNGYVPTFLEIMAWFRSQLKLEPAPKMPSLESLIQWENAWIENHANDRGNHRPSPLHVYDWLSEQLGLGDEAR
jgi:hypothetical protein